METESAPTSSPTRIFSRQPFADQHVANIAAAHRYIAQLTAIDILVAVDRACPPSDAVVAEPEDDDEEGDLERQYADDHRPRLAPLGIAIEVVGGLLRHRRRIAADSRHADGAARKVDGLLTHDGRSYDQTLIIRLAQRDRPRLAGRTP